MKCHGLRAFNQAYELTSTIIENIIQLQNFGDNSMNGQGAMICISLQVSDVSCILIF
jgi:hypothetical protein